MINEKEIKVETEGTLVAEQVANDESSVPLDGDSSSLAKDLSSAAVSVVQARFYQIFPPKFAYGVSDSTLGPFYEYPVGLLELETADGAKGYGLLPVGRITSEILEDYFLPLLLESAVDLSNIEAFWLRCLARIRNTGAGHTHQVLAGIDIALWDLAAKVADKPLHKLLGGARDTLPVYGSNGWTNHSQERLVEGMVELVARGFTTLKMKVGVEAGTDINRDAARVRAVRAAVGADVRLAVDANQCWTVADALRFAEQIADEDIAWFEEPIDAHNFLGYRELAARSPVRLAAGECLTNPFAFETLAALEGLKVFQPELTRIAGITGFRRAARIAEKYDVKIISGGFAHLICSCVAAARTGTMSEYLVPFMDSFDSVWTEKPAMANGAWLLPDKAGHGLTPDFEFIEKHSHGEPIRFTHRSRASVRVY